MINVTRADHRSPALPAGDHRGGILVTLHGQELDAMIRILTVVTRQSTPGIHDTVELGGERPVAQLLLDRIDAVVKTIRAENDYKFLCGVVQGLRDQPDKLLLVAEAVATALGRERGAS